MASVGGDELSWPEVQEICGQLESMLHVDASKDAQRLRSLAEKRKEIASTFQSRQSAAHKQLAHLRANLSEWEEKEQTAKQRNEQLHTRLQELEAIKRDMAVQLDRFRLNEKTSKESLDLLLDKYEETKQELVQYNAEHQNDIPMAKYKMALYASVTGIRWDFNGPKIVGDIHVPPQQHIIRFEIVPETDDFTAANALWDKIDEAFGDIDSDL